MSFCLKSDVASSNGSFRSSEVILLCTCSGVLGCFPVESRSFYRILLTYAWEFIFLSVLVRCPGPDAAKEAQPTVGMMVSSLPCKDLVLHDFSKKHFSLSFISSENMLPTPLSVSVLFHKFSSQQCSQLPPWCPTIDALLAEAFTYHGLMGTDANHFQ